MAGEYVFIYGVAFYTANQTYSPSYSHYGYHHPYLPINDLTVYFEQDGRAYHGVYNVSMLGGASGLTMAYPFSYLTPYAPYRMHPNISSAAYYLIIVRKYDKLIVEVTNFRGWERWRIDLAKIKEKTGMTLIKVYCPTRIVDGSQVTFVETNATSAEIALQYNLPLWTAYIYERQENQRVYYTVVVPDEFGYAYITYPPDTNLNDLLFTVGGVLFVKFNSANAQFTTTPQDWGDLVGTAKVISVIFRCFSSETYKQDFYRHILPSEAPDLNLPSPSDGVLLNTVGELLERQLNADYNPTAHYWSPSDTEIALYQPSLISRSMQLVTYDFQRRFFAPKYCYLPAANWDYGYYPKVLSDRVAVCRYVPDRNFGQIDLYKIPYVFLFEPTPLSGNTRKQVINTLRLYCTHLAELSPRNLLAVFNESAFEEREELVTLRSLNGSGVRTNIPIKFHVLKPFATISSLCRCSLTSLSAIWDCPMLRLTFNDLPEALVIKAIDCADWRQNYVITSLPVTGRVGINYPFPSIIRPSNEAIVVRGNPTALRRPPFTNPLIKGWLAACYLNEGCYVLSYSGSEWYGEYFALTGRGLYYVAKSGFTHYAVGGYEYVGTAFWQGLGSEWRLNYSTAMLRWGWNAFLHLWSSAAPLLTHSSSIYNHKGLTVGRFHSPTLARLYGNLKDSMVQFWHNPDILWRLVRCKVNLADTLPEPYRTGYKVLFGELSGAFIYFGNGIAEAFAPIWLGYDFENYRNKWAIAFWRVNSYDHETDTILSVQPYPEIVNLEFKPTT